VLLEVHPEVEDDHRVGQRPHGDEVDPGQRDLARPLQGQATGRLEAGEAGGDPDDAQARSENVVENYQQ